LAVLSLPHLSNTLNRVLQALYPVLDLWRVWKRADETQFRSHEKDIAVAQQSSV